ncbi:MAG: M23 family metallopeptidase, partial [Candidatus Kerfeldbacteria bacterium]|nr:M23 family metallopeptidase [Candidatus Kerfeldbacteria bacterium]
MERYFRLLMLCIVTMFGIILINQAQAEEIPFEFHTPYQKGVTVLGGGSGTNHGSYYNEAPYHDGTSYYCIDLNAPNNDGYSVTAIAGGIVVADRESGHNGYGTAFSHDIAIQHEDNYYSLYMHLRSNSVSVGDEVRAGQVIGVEGANGTDSSHLHFCIFNSSGNSVKPSPMDGQLLEDEELQAGQTREDNINSLSYGQYYGHNITSNNREVTEEAFDAIRTKADELWADDLIQTETENMHWYGGDDATDTTFIIEDWDGGTWGSGDDWVALTFDPSNVDQTEAYVLRHGFWEIYRTYGGPDVFGAPLGDELDTTRLEYDPYDPDCSSKESCIQAYCGPTSEFTSVQRFGEATFCWYSPSWQLCLGDPNDDNDINDPLPYCYELTNDAIHQPPDRTLGVTGTPTPLTPSYPDLLVYYPTMGGWWLARNTGTTATYYANLFQNMYTQGANEHWYLPVPNDFSGDGYDDLIIYTQAGDWSGIAS